MSLYDKIFKRSLNEQQESMNSLIKSLSNLTPEDIDILQDIADNNLEDIKSRIKSDEPVSMLDTLEKIYSRSFNYGDNTPHTRKQLYQVYDEMDETISYISAALDIISDDATQADQEGFVLRITSESEKVQNLTTDLFDDFSIEEKLSKWARVVAKYGDFFIKLTYEDGKGITKINDSLYPSSIERKDFDGELLAFSNLDDMSTNNLKAPWDYVHFRHNGTLTNNNNKLNSITDPIISEEYNLSSNYGQSILKPSIKVYAQLRFVENMILLGRLTNSIRRNIFMINVGDQSPDKSFETIQNYANLLKKNVNLDLEQGIYNSQKKTVSYDEDIFIPVSDPKNDVRVEQVGGDVNISEQYDLEYLLNKLFSALKIPKAYLNYEQDLNARSTLIQLDIRYARSVSRLQQTLRGGLLRLAKINLAFLGIDPESVDLDIQLTPVSTITSEAQREELAGKLDLANRLWDTLLSINDKLSGGDGVPGMSVGGPPMGLGGLFEDDNQSKTNIETKKDEESNDTNKLDLEFAAEKILLDYVGFSNEEVSKLFKRPSTEDSETKKVKIRIKRSMDPDLNSMYPTEEGVSTFVKLRESILSKEEDKEEDKLL